MFRIAAGGFIYQTNSFAPKMATLKDFRLADGWPGVVAASLRRPDTPVPNLAPAGFLRHLQGQRQKVHPLIWYSATSGGPLEDEAFEHMTAQLLARIEPLLPLDGLYLDLHGAMVTPSFPDGEGELLTRIRALTGPDCRIVISLNLSANLSHAMLNAVDWVVGCRTYPHLDLAKTGERAAEALIRLLMDRLKGNRMTSSMLRLPFLIPLTRQSTQTRPMADIMGRRAQLEPADGTLEFFTGFPDADTAVTGPTVVCHGHGLGVIDVVKQLHDYILEQERAFATTLFSARMAARHARQQYRGKPIVIADTQDNPGAGAPGDATGMLEALLEEQVDGAVVVPLYDPVSAAKAHKLGIGAAAEFTVGGISGLKEIRPVTGVFLVEALANGQCIGAGPCLRGMPIHLGPMAVLRQGGVRVVVCSVRQQCADRAILRHIGIQPEECTVLALKSSVQFRADFEPIAADVLIATAPGAHSEDPSRLPYRHLVKGTRLIPGGLPFKESILRRKAG